jgi:type II secretory pathway predicted ATPase ExeA
VYLDYFGLNEAPFRITPNTEYWYAGGQRGEMLSALLYAIGQGEGIIKVVGEVGSGKTMLCRKLVAQLPETVDSVYLGNPTLDPDDMLAAILADLEEAPASGRQARLAQLNDALLARHEAGRRVVVFVEEAQGISLDNLEFLRLLTNLETATDKLLQIVLFGQPELDAQLAVPRIRQLKDRITLSLTLSPLNAAEVADYLRARLTVAGYRGPDLFPPELITRMTQLSGGLSRRINVLADKTLLAAYAAQTRTLSPAHLDAAASDDDANPQRQRHAWRHRLPHWAWLSAGLAAALGLLAFVAWMALSPSPSTPAAKPPAAPAQTALPLPAAAFSVADVTEMARQTRLWLVNAAPSTRVIQLTSVKEAAQAAVLLGELSAAPYPQPLRVLHGLDQGDPAWMILSGEFTDRAEAGAALQALSGQTAGSPFLRTVRTMRTLVLPSG